MAKEIIKGFAIECCVNCKEPIRLTDDPLKRKGLYFMVFNNEEDAQQKADRLDRKVIEVQVAL